MYRHEGADAYTGNNTRTFLATHCMKHFTAQHELAFSVSQYERLFGSDDMSFSQVFHEKQGHFVVSDSGWVKVHRRETVVEESPSGRVETNDMTETKEPPFDREAKKFPSGTETIVSVETKDFQSDDVIETCRSSAVALLKRFGITGDQGQWCMDKIPWLCTVKGSSTSIQ
jgi:hypothetical protein